MKNLVLKCLKRQNANMKKETIAYLFDYLADSFSKFCVSYNVKKELLNHLILYRCWSNNNTQWLDILITLFPNIRNQVISVKTVLLK